MSGREAPARGGKRKRAISPTRSDGAESEAVGTARSTTTAPPAVTVQRSDKGATSVLMAMWDMPETHDVRLLLTSEDVTLSAHRAVLAAASRPFRGQFGGLGQFKEAAGGGAAVMAPVSVPDVDAASMRGMLSFIYGHKVELTLENALSLYRVSDYYEVLELADRCCAFLAKRTTADNCCSLLAAAEAASCDKLSAHCYEELKRQFEQAAATPAFCELPRAVVASLLQEDDPLGLQARSEEVLLTALLSWYDHAPAARRAHALELAQLIRWPWVPAATIARLEQERSELFAEPSLVQLSREAYRQQALEASPEGQAVLSASAVLPSASPRAKKRRLRHCDYASLQVQVCIGQKGSKEAEFNCPEGLAVSRDGSVVVADSLNHRVQMFAADGSFLRAFGGHGDQPGEFNMPGGVAVGSDAGGDELIVVTDQGNGRVQIFDLEGQYLRQVGAPGSDDGRLIEPTGVAVTAAGDIVVADYQNHRVQIFDSQGAFVLKFGRHGSGHGQFNHPSGIAIAPSGEIVVADYQNDRLQVFTQDGTFVRTLGSNGRGPGEFDRPFDVTISSDGHILVTDYENHRVQILSEAGAFLKQFGSHGQAPGCFDSPGGVAMGPDGRVFVTDCGNGRFQVYKSDPP
eukprot:Transcript_23800.p2 GENE.Transcript_23800~~Transcript_23800.p2  ORF type:complete len:671 (+),score=302.65 Transcript_23800:121-2013(+)